MINFRNLATPRLPRVAAGTLVIVLVILAAVMGGLIVSLGDKLLDLMLFGALGGCFLLFLPLPFVMLTLIVTALLIAGTAEYFGRITQAHWIPFLMALALYVRLPLEMLRHAGARRDHVRNRNTPALYWIIAIYLAVIVLSTLANQAPISQTLVGAKSYMFFWSFLFLILVADVPPEQLDAFWKSIVVVAVLQLPFVLYQHFVIAKARGGEMYGADAVVGTFGGDPNHGGSSATLLLFMLIAALYMTALYREGLLARRWWLASLTLSGTVVALGETKIAFVLIPVCFFIIYADRFRRNPGSLVGFAAAMAVVIGILLAFYQFAYWEGTYRSRGLGESIEKSVSYIVDPKNMTRETGEVGRVAALNLWWQDPRADAMTRTIGYGPGASRGRSAVTLGEVARRYLPFEINSTAAAALLWELGVIGFLCFSTILVSGALLAYRVAGRVAPNSPQRAGLRTAAAALVCLFIMIPYNRTAVDQAAVQLLMVFCLAYTLFWARRQKVLPPRV